jgi:hypothetical protein
MIRPRLDDDARKRERLTVRFRPGELSGLSEQADMSGLSVSELVRRRALKMRVIPATDLRTLSELRRIGGLVKHLFNESNGLYRQKTSALLYELHAAVVRVGRRQERQEED